MVLAAQMYAKEERGVMIMIGEEERQRLAKDIEERRRQVTQDKMAEALAKKLIEKHLKNYNRITSFLEGQQKIVDLINVHCVDIKTGIEDLKPSSRAEVEEGLKKTQESAKSFAQAASHYLKQLDSEKEKMGKFSGDSVKYLGELNNKMKAHLKKVGFFRRLAAKVISGFAYVVTKVKQNLMKEDSYKFPIKDWVKDINVATRMQKQTKQAIKKINRDNRDVRVVSAHITKIVSSMGASRADLDYRGTGEFQELSMSSDKSVIRAAINEAIHSIKDAAQEHIKDDVVVVPPTPGRGRGR